MAAPAPPLGDILATLQLDDLEEPADQVDGLPMITKCQYLASYNWLYREEPRIFVPGRKISIKTKYLHDHELIHVYKVSHRLGHLPQSLLGSKKTPVNTIVT
jgi:hypothetical protein